MLKNIIVPIIITFIVIVVTTVWWLYENKKNEVPKTTGLPIKVARYYWPGFYWVEIADRKGWFKESGLNVELVDTNQNYYASLDDMASGKIDTNGFYLYDLINYRMKGYDLVAVVNQDNSLGVDAIVAKKEIESILDLKGKTIGLSKDTYLEYLLSVILEKKRLNLSDVVIADMSGEKTKDAFIAGKVDAIVVWEPFVTEAIIKGNGRKLFDTSKKPCMMPAVTAFHQNFIEKRPHDVQMYVNVWHKTTEFIKENPKDSFGIIAEIYGVTPDEVQALAQLDRILDLRDNVTAFSYGAGFESLHGTARRINNFMVKKGMTKGLLDSTEFIDHRFIRALKRSRGYKLPLGLAGGR